uniref:G2/mitotic-specific cyclin-B3 n=1 Tax=Leptobrachium leishanense TaxID=445787 RepID=A0A8C5PGY7_9ANUR
MMPSLRQTRPVTSKPSRPGKPLTESIRPEKEESVQIKRSPSSPQGGAKKRSAFGDLTNAHKNNVLQKKKEGQKGLVKKTRNVPPTATAKNNELNLKKTLKKITSGELVPEVVKQEKVSSEETPSPEILELVHQRTSLDKKRSQLQRNQLASFITSILIKHLPPEVVDTDSPQRLLPPDVEDIDKDCSEDPFSNSEYAMDIFNYMREREVSLQLNHETLYLAVKLVDHYLAVSVIAREKLQLIGSTAVLISSKFDERGYPCLDDFLYICGNAYKREELLSMEKDILRELNFDINIPVSYRFLRRFAKCAHASMETLTLARYICELTLQEYDFVQESASKMAASCLLLALKMKDLGGWTATLWYYSGYQSIELVPLVKRLNFLLADNSSKLKAVRSKYTHKVFFEVAKLAPLDLLTLEATLES